MRERRPHVRTCAAIVHAGMLERRGSQRGEKCFEGGAVGGGELAEARGGGSGLAAVPEDGYTLFAAGRGTRIAAAIARSSTQRRQLLAIAHCP